MPTTKGSKELGSSATDATTNRLARYRTSGAISGARTTDPATVNKKTLGNDKTNGGAVNNTYTRDLSSLLKNYNK